MLKRNVFAVVLLLAALLAPIPCYAEGEMVMTVTSTADSGAGSLREAVNEVAPNGVILFDDSLNKARINLESFLLIDKPITIEASNLADGVIIVGSGQSVIKVDGGDKSIAVSLMNLRISGQATGEILLVSRATLNMGNCQIIGNKSGRGITAANAAITMTNCAVGGNGPADNGGGIYAGDKAKITMEKCSIANNSANKEGGGLFVAEGSEVILNECIINKNTANSAGGGIRINKGKLTVDKSSITANRTTWGGGYYDGGKTEVRNSLIALNVASEGGGGFGVWSNSGESVLIGSVVAGNSAKSAGGIMIGHGKDHKNAPTKISGSSISGNSPHGIVIYVVDAQIKNSTISQNTVDGVWIDGGAQNVKIEYCTIANNKASGIFGNGKQITLKRNVVAGNAADINSLGMTMDSTHNVFGSVNKTGIPQNAAKVNAPKEKVIAEPVRHETLLCADGSGEKVPLYYPLVAAQNNEFTAIDIIPADEYEYELDGDTTDQLGKPRPTGFFSEEKNGDSGAIEMQKK